MFFANKPRALKSSARFSHAIRLLVAGGAAASLPVATPTISPSIWQETATRSR